MKFRDYLRKVVGAPVQGYSTIDPANRVVFKVKDATPDQAAMIRRWVREARAELAAAQAAERERNN